MKLALFSYNAFVPNGINGWNNGTNNSVLLVQDPEGRPWGTQQSGISTTEMAQETVTAIENGWQGMASEINNLDKLYIYVGSYGAEQAIKLARENNIPSEKVTFVMCDCSLENKKSMIQKCNYEDAEVIMCECGGRNTMTKLYDKYMKN